MGYLNHKAETRALAAWLEPLRVGDRGSYPEVGFYSGNETFWCEIQIELCQLHLNHTHGC